MFAALSSLCGSLPRYVRVPYLAVDVGLELHRWRGLKMTYVGGSQDGAHFAICGFVTVGFGQIYAW